MYKLGLAHEAKPERVAAPSIPIEESGPQDGTEVGSKGAAGACSQQNSPKHEDGTPASPHPSASVVPGTGEATGEEATTAAPTRFLIHNIIDGLGVTFGFCFGIYCFCDLNLKEEGRRTRRDVDAREMSRTHFDKNTT